MENHERQVELDKKVMLGVRRVLNTYGSYLNTEMVNDVSFRINYIQQQGGYKDLFTDLKEVITKFKYLGILGDGAIRLANEESQVGRYGFVFLMFNPPFSNQYFQSYSVS